MNNLFKRGGEKRPMNVWDILSIVMLVMTVCVVLYFAMIFFNPYSSLNPLPPNQGSADQNFGIPTSTPAPIKLQPTWTASPTLEMTPTNTPRPTFTALFTDTPYSIVPPTRTPNPTKTPKAPFAAISVQQVDSTLIHPEFGCNWAGIGGTVVDANNSPVIGTVVVLRGSLGGLRVEQQNLSGINKEYGPSGFEFVIGNEPVASNKTLYVQLVDLSGIPLSDKVEITTSTDCAKNLVMVRFKKNR